MDRKAQWQATRDAFFARLQLRELRGRGSSRNTYELWIGAGDDDTWPTNAQLIDLADQGPAPFGGDARLINTQADGTRVYTVNVNVD